MKKQLGFTLVELLLVLAIIGIICALVIPLLTGHRDSARQKSTEAIAQSIASELDSAAKMRSGSTAASIITYVRALPNFTYPACKNAYNPTISPIVLGTAANDGEVGLLAAVQGDTNGQNITVIKVTCKYSSNPLPVTMANVPIE